MSVLTTHRPGAGWGNQLHLSPASWLLAQVEQAQVKASRSLNAQRKVAYGQFFTPLPVATRMAAMLGHVEESAHILDAGAGVGSLFTARVALLCRQERHPASIHVTAYEIDPLLAEFACASLQLCRQACFDAGIAFVGEVIESDFLEHGLDSMGYGLFAAQSAQSFTEAIVNPPYRKIQASSRERKLLHQIGIEATNLYVGFVELTMRLLAPGGSLVSITPRSFCNGVYFKKFRRAYFHAHNSGMSPALARGLAAFLNSTLVDVAFRQFSGHTQVNATDLRSLRYPTREQLEHLGRAVGFGRSSQAALDELIRGELAGMTEDGIVDVVRAKQRIDEAIAILKALGFPRTQQNERSALTLLALLDIAPTSSWAEASAPMRGVTPLMEFFARHYGKTYAPNSRETVRRQTLHPFLDAALVRINPDDVDRPVNSGQTVYQVEANALALLRLFGSPDWQAALEHYLSTVTTLKERYAHERFMARIHALDGDQLLVSLPRQNKDEGDHS